MPKKKKEEAVPSLELKGENITENISEKLENVDDSFQESSENLTKALQVSALSSKQAGEVVGQLCKTISISTTDPFIRNENGTVNWRKMIKAEHVVVKKEYVSEIEKKYGKQITEIPIEQLEDKYLLILLQGIKELAELRGYSSVRYPNVVAQPDFVSVYCEIVWQPFEDQKDYVVFGDGGDAHPGNTNDVFRDYLTPIAFNRAFVRAVRNFLKINITGKDEIGSPRKANEEDAPSQKTNPRGVLETKISELKTKTGSQAFPDFAKFKDWWVKRGNTDASTWNSVADIPNKTVWELLAVFNDIQSKQVIKE